LSEGNGNSWTKRMSCEKLDAKYEENKMAETHCGTSTKI
jgi:hypothetical protein